MLIICVNILGIVEKTAVFKRMKIFKKSQFAKRALKTMLFEE
jgi:hypothetical protein